MKPAHRRTKSGTGHLKKKRRIARTINEEGKGRGCSLCGQGRVTGLAGNCSPSSERSREGAEDKVVSEFL